MDHALKEANGLRPTQRTQRKLVCTVAVVRQCALLKMQPAAGEEEDCACEPQVALGKPDRLSEGAVS